MHFVENFLGRLVKEKELQYTVVVHSIHVFESVCSVKASGIQLQQSNFILRFQSFLKQREEDIKEWKLVCQYLIRLFRITH